MTHVVIRIAVFNGASKKYKVVFKSFQQLMIVNFSMMNIIKKVITFTQFAG